MEDLKQIQEFFSKPLEEVTKSQMLKKAKKGSYPATLVAIENGKVVAQEKVSTPQEAPAAHSVMSKKYPNANIRLEDSTGKILEEGKQLDIEDFAKVVKAVEQTGHPVTVLLIPKFNEIEVITGMNAPDDMLFDLSNAVDSLGYGRNDIIIAADSSNLSRREYSDIHRVNGGAKDYFEESLNEATKKEYNALLDKEHELTKAYSKDKTDANWKKLSDIRKKGKKLEKELEDQAIAENNSYARVSKPRFIKDKNNPNFLNVYLDYDIGPGGNSIAFGKETMTGQIRRESAAKAMQLANKVAKDLEAKYNLEDIDIVDLKNGKVRIFAVSDDFVDMQEKDLNIKEYNTGIYYHPDKEKSSSNSKKSTLQKVKDMIKTAVKEGDITVDDKTEFKIDLKHLLDKHVVKSEALSDFEEEDVNYDKLYSDYKYKVNEVKPKKGHGEKISKEVFAKLKGKTISYKGADYKVVDSDEAVLTLKDEDGKSKTINLRQFNISGMIEEILETIELGKQLKEGKLCPEGEAYRKRRMAAGEKSSAYLSGRAVKVCKGQMKG